MKLFYFISCFILGASLALRWEPLTLLFIYITIITLGITLIKTK